MRFARCFVFITDFVVQLNPFARRKLNLVCCFFFRQERRFALIVVAARDAVALHVVRHGDADVDDAL